ncbi:MAG: LamG domain-containing protein [Pseudonocardiaceae bacterium]
MALLAAYAFDEGSGTTAADASGNGYDIDLAGTSVGFSGDGHTNSAVTSSGTTAASLPADIGQSTDRTVMAWLKGPFSVAVWPIQWHVASIDSGAWGILALSGEIHIQARNSTTFIRASTVWPADGEYHHVAGTYDEAGSTLTLYLDGVETDTATLVGPLRTDAAPPRLFGVVETDLMDDLRIFGEALDQTAIAAAMDSPVNVGPATITPDGIAPAEAFGASAVAPGPVTVSPGGIGAAEQFGAAVVVPGAVTLTPAGIASGEVFGVAMLTTGTITLTPAGIASAETFGVAVVGAAIVTLTPVGIASAETFGVAAFKRGSVVAEHGAKAVRDRVAALLVADLGARIDAMCELWVLDAATFPAPDRVISHGDTPADPRYPGTLAVTSGEPPDFALDHTARSWVEVITPRLMPKTQTWGLTPRGNLLYRFRYACKLYVWALGDTWREALDARDRLAVAVRDALFDLRTLQIPPASGDSGYLVDPNTMSEEFGAPFRIAGKSGTNPRVRAAALLNYEVIHEHETGVPTTRPDDGPYTGYDLAVSLLPWTRPTPED